MVDGLISSSLPVSSGGSQGSILGPLLFLIFVNDLLSATDVDSSLYLYADDTKCFKIIRGYSDANALQADLDILYGWTQQWYLRFNEQKCESLTISRKRSPLCYGYKVGSHVIKSTKCQKDLGVLVTSDLKWSQHTSAAVGRAVQDAWLAETAHKVFQ